MTKRRHFFLFFFFVECLEKTKSCNSPTRFARYLHFIDGFATAVFIFLNSFSFFSAHHEPKHNTRPYCQITTENSALANLLQILKHTERKRQKFRFTWSTWDKHNFCICRSAFHGAWVLEDFFLLSFSGVTDLY